MRKITVLLIAVLLANFVVAQRDKKATDILDKVIAETESHATIEVNFTYKMVNPEADIDESKEGVLLVKGNAYRLSLIGQVMISDGTTLWTLLQDDEEVMINNVEENNDAITPNNLLKSYQDNYKSKFLKEEIVKGKTVEIIELTPIEGKNYIKVEVTIDKKKKQILNFSIFDKNGSTYSYIINKYTIDIETQENTFTFRQEDYPDFEIVDMR